MDFWITDGSASGTHELLAEAAGATAAKDPLGLNPSELTLFNGEVFFNSFDKSGLPQLWETDGTAAGTQMLAPATASPAQGLNPLHLEVYNGQLLFEGISKRVNGSGGYPGLLTTDGTAAGTQEITPAGGSGHTSGKPYPYGFIPTDLTALRPESDPPTVTSSILWQNTSTGQASIWDMNGSTLVGGGAVSANPGPSWTEIGTGDFNDDGLSDILWRNASTGQASIWEMNGNNLLGGGAVSAQSRAELGQRSEPAISIRTACRDILWRNTSTGQASIWEMNGNSFMGGGAVSANPGLAWTAIGTGDFNQDGFSDILWQNADTGQVSIWEMNGNSLIGGGPVSPNPGPSWQAIGTGDFNQDGFSDILFQNKGTGQVSVWEMHGTSLTGGGQVSANPGTSWHAIGTGGGGSDILLQNTSGQVSIWEMNGNSIAGGGPVSPNPGPNWQAVGLT